VRTSALQDSLTATQEDYIRAIYLLEKEYGGGVTVTALVKKLGLSKSTVSERILTLQRGGLVFTKPYTPITLTVKGRKLGLKLTRKHRLLEVFLHNTLKLPLALVHAEAERLEHACSDTMIAHLATFLHHPTHDPHGSKIPK
jgi:DtxR family transcriptional regulator, Mn-dependent transcriptional regulator